MGVSVKLGQTWFDFCRENNGWQISVVLLPVFLRWELCFHISQPECDDLSSTSFAPLISSLVYTLSKRFSRSFFMVQVSAPYNRILSTEARKNTNLVSLQILDFHIRCSLLQADQASALRMLKSFLPSLMNDPRHSKSSALFRDVPFKVRISFPVDS